MYVILRTTTLKTIQRDTPKKTLQINQNGILKTLKKPTGRQEKENRYERVNRKQRDA